tara:strand:+ start:1971 stop:2624 length:654 start_codon:yes stop_codon:yes gene_type:complete
MENNFTRQGFDSCAYDEKLKRTMGPGLYQVQVPSNDIFPCKRDIPADPSIRYQQYGYSTCPAGQAIDDETELMGLNYKNSKCNNQYYQPGSYSKEGFCSVPSKVGARDCGYNPQESTRISNPPCNLHGTGINRWNWLCFEPQDHAIERFSREGTDVRTLFKDNHVPCLEKLVDESPLLPPIENNKFDPSYKVPTNNDLDTISNRYPYGLTPGSKCVK